MSEPSLRDTLVSHARFLTEREKFSHEDSARVSALLAIADRADGTADLRHSPNSPENRAFDAILRGRERRADVADSERRALTEAGLPSQSTPTSIFAPQDFADRCYVAQKAYDRLFDSDVTNHITASPGRPLPIPILDDTAASASLASEGSQDAMIDPFGSAVILPAAPTWRSGEVQVSNELRQDAGFDLAGLLAAAFGVRLARGVGASLVSTLTSSAPVAVTATGSSKNTGGTETGGTSIGTSDLIALRTSINPAYRAGGRAWWVMNDNTLSFIDAILDKQGRPVFTPCYDADGERLLLGYRVALCPSMPNIGLSNTPIAFGAMDRFAVRRGPLAVQALYEKLAEFDITAFRAYMRSNATLLIPSGGDSPIKLLKNAAS